MSGFLSKGSCLYRQTLRQFRNIRPIRFSRRHVSSLCVVCCGGMGLGLYTFRKKGILLCKTERPIIEEQSRTIISHLDKTDIQSSVLQNVSIVLRLSYLVILFSPAILLHLISYVVDSTSIRNWKLLYIRFALQKAGPAFVKFGQWVSMRRDMFHPHVCKTLCGLQKDCYTHSWDHTEKVLESEIGQNWEEYFEEIDKTPIGSGCVAQVYKWILSDVGLMKAGCTENNKECELTT